MTTNTSATLNNAIETVEVSSVITTKRVAYSLGFTALVVGAVFGYRAYKAGKAVVEAVTEEAPAEEPATTEAA